MKQWLKRLVLLVAMASAWTVHAVTLPGPLVETAWLAEHKAAVVLLDVRADVKSFTAKPRYIKDKKTGKQKLVRVGGHIPGAALVNYKKVRADQKIGDRVVTRMLPDKAAFAALMRAAGVNRDSVVVIASKGESNADMTMATRLYWQLKYFGHDQLAILDGGLAQWILDGREVSSRATVARAGNWQAGPGRPELLATSEEVAAALQRGDAQLVDTRSVSQYLGTWNKSYVYDKGHIPGAKVFPNELLTGPAAPARFLPSAQLKALLGELGVRNQGPAITYCNSGHLASGSWFVMSELLGNKDVQLYDGSTHQWTLEKRPVRAMKME